MKQERDEDRRINDRVDRAQRLADGNWSFTGPSSTLSMRQWREPSTMSTMSRVPSALAPSGAPAGRQEAQQNHRARPEPVQMPTLEDFDYDGDEGPMLPVERLAQPAPLLAPPPLVPEPLVAGPVVGHPNSIGPGTAVPPRPSQPPAARRVNIPSTQAKARAKGQGIVALLFGLLFFAPALSGLIGQAIHSTTHTEQVQPVDPALDGNQEWSTNFGSFTMPVGWTQSGELSDENLSFVLDSDSMTTLSVSHASRLGGSLDSDCQQLLGSGEATSKLSGTPRIDGQPSVGFRQIDNGTTTKVFCAPRDGGMVSIVGSTQDSPFFTVDEAMKTVARSFK
ncbi:hypothetical protein AAEX63_08560 [Luteococcus sp. H138]|uniref:hypothetical protein n=1 Tax=unclassified Luteococcus TaxID=2639923 RepID=UPI00313AF16B